MCITPIANEHICNISMNLTEGEKPSPPFLWFQSLGDERILAPWLKKPRTELEVKTRNCD